ncbi:Putative serine protease HtrA [Stieleria maiorica]|uniref:Serine protease HtrA n=1 Tax=Stieleria maiorica TaxID=2795974 RepID=A0A5B9MDP2_9BACT|nr:transglutaminase family protein [Stieleria maiorica]QEF98356.1 Putative serine protease HtrA [Stieleria maiorica]
MDLRTLFCLPLLIAIASPSQAAADDDQSHQSLIAKVRPSVMTIRVQGRDGDPMGIGTGFVIDSDGLIATNFHVINEGRPFTVESPEGKKLRVLGVEASDVSSDLAIIHVDPGSTELPALEFAGDDSTRQGIRVLAFGNPLGLRNSVVEGIVSARREVEGRELLQLAMPIEPGNSGGPLVDLKGRVHGIINMKSSIDDNLGFAIPVSQLVALKENPNPVTLDRWVRIGRINDDRWTPVMGSRWQQRGGRIVALGAGNGFGGRSLLLSKRDVPQRPFEIAVMVRLDDESGAAGLAFHSDGQNQHYGFYASAGRLRLTCFRGASVYSWDILKEVETEYYLPGQWNQLKVRVGDEKILCYVNGRLVIESDDRQITEGQVGLAKFRDTEPEFSGFQLGAALDLPVLSEAGEKMLAQLDPTALPLDSVGSDQIRQLGTSGDLAWRELTRRAIELETQAKRMHQLADDVRRADTVDRLSRLDAIDDDERLLTGSLLIAKLDSPDLDVEAYRERIDEMAGEILAGLDADASATEIRDAMHRYLFQENGFHGSRSEYYHAANSQLNRVIDDREGLPITMSVLYIELGRRLGIKVVGVGLPGHFVAKHVIDTEQDQLIDVFERGKLLSQEDAAEIVAAHAGRRIRDSDLQASTDIEILTRILNNLIGVAGRMNDGEAMLRYCDAIVAVNPDEPRYRMMRAQLRGMTGRINLALEDVEMMLQHDPPELDRGATERLRDALIERL